MESLEKAKSLIAAGQIDGVEDQWLAKQAEDSIDIGFFTGVASLLSKAKENETATFLLELLDEQLKENGSWDKRLELLKQCGHLYLEPLEIHSAALSTLEKLYPASSCLDALIDRTGLLRAVEDTRKTWTKISRLKGLMQFEEGTYVWMEGTGSGRVVEVNQELESFKLELTDRSEVRVGFAAAAKVLQVLEPGHFERRKLEDLDTLLQLKKSAPGDLLILALESRDRPLPAAEIRKAMSGILEEGEWNSWWARARKHSRVLSTTAKGKQAYTWAASEDHALEEVSTSFAAADVEGKLDILRRNAERSADLASEMTEELRKLAEECLHDDPATALEIWYSIERFGSTSELDWSPSAIVAECADPIGLLRTLSDKNLRERFYDVCWTERSDREAVFREALGHEEDPRLLTKLAERLGSRHPDELKIALDDILGHPRRHCAAFVWFAESGEDLDLLAERNPLRLIRQILDALHQSEFSRYRSRLQKTFETGGGATHLFTRLSEDQASQAEQAVKSSPLEDHLRDTLVRFLHVRFPSLDSSKETPLYATEASIKSRRQEFEKLQTEEIPANRKAIEEARELGDLRENFEYKSARQRHEYLNSRLASLTRDLARVRPLTSEGLDPSEARIGCRVDLESVAGETRPVTILGPWESDPDRDVVSYDSDLGQSLLGKKPGDAITIEDQTWTLVGIAPWT